MKVKTLPAKKNKKNIKPEVKKATKNFIKKYKKLLERLK